MSGIRYRSTYIRTHTKPERRRRRRAPPCRPGLDAALRWLLLLLARARGCDWCCWGGWPGRLRARLPVTLGRGYLAYMGARTNEPQQQMAVIGAAAEAEQLWPRRRRQPDSSSLQQLWHLPSGQQATHSISHALDARRPHAPCTPGRDNACPPTGPLVLALARSLSLPPPHLELGGGLTGLTGLAGLARSCTQALSAARRASFPGWPLGEVRRWGVEQQSPGRLRPHALAPGSSLIASHWAQSGGLGGRRQRARRWPRALFEKQRALVAPGFDGGRRGQCRLRPPRADGAGLTASRCAAARRPE